MQQVSLFEKTDEVYSICSPWDTWLKEVDVRIVSNLSDWTEALLDVRLSGRCGLDFETTGLDPHTSEIRLVQLSVPRGRKVVADDWVSPSGKADVWVADLFKFEERAKVLEGLLDLIEDPNVIKVLQNAVFEIKFVRAASGRRVAARGIFDVMLASQLCAAGYYLPDEQWEQYCSKNGIRSEWASVPTAQDGEIGREKVWLDSRGRPVEVKRDTIRKAVRASHTLSAIALRHLDALLDKSFQKSDWSGALTANQMLYAARDAAILLPLHEILNEALSRNKLQRVAEIEFSCIPVTAEIEFKGLGFDAEAAREMLEPLNAAVAELRGTLREIACSLCDWLEEFNPDSAEDVGLVLVLAAKEDGFTIDGRAVKIGEEIFPLSSSADVLDRIAARVDRGSHLARFHEALKRYRDVKKQSDFLCSWLGFVHTATKRLHPSLRQINPNGVGRFSAYNPNIQQIPRKSDLRGLFCAPEGRVLVVGDYSAIEVRIMAELAGDEALLRVFKEGRDPHRATAAGIAGKPETEVTDEERQAAKSAVFGYLYGMQADTFRQYAETNYCVRMSREEAEHARESFFSLYPGVAAYHNRQFNLCWSDGFAVIWRHDVHHGFFQVRLPVVRTLTGRMRVWPAVDFTTRNGKQTRRKHGSFTEAYNTPDQGTGADIIKRAMCLLYDALLTRGWEDVFLVATEHDALVLEAPEDKATEVKDLLATCMLQAGQEILSRVPVEVKCGIGPSWASAKK